MTELEAAKIMAEELKHCFYVGEHLRAHLSQALMEADRILADIGQHATLRNTRFTLYRHNVDVVNVVAEIKDRWEGIMALRDTEESISRFKKLNESLAASREDVKEKEAKSGG